MSGPVSAPYWGQLPTVKNRRGSTEYSQGHHRRQSLDEPVSTSQPLPRSNRASTQTTATEAATDSTYSPLASPVTSTFKGAGLAPRPPSLPYGQNNYPQELLDRRKRRASRNQEEDLQYETARATPPAAPDIPRAPPVSYNPYGNGRSSPYTFNAAGQPGPPPSAHRSLARAKAEAATDMESEGATPPPVRRQRRMSTSESTQPRMGDDELEMRRARRAANSSERGDLGKSGSLKHPGTGTGVDRNPTAGRRESLGPEGQRKPWADDRSPLQKLELTLDSITKEEKRARVEAAERRAREKAALAAAAVKSDSESRSNQPDRSAFQQVRFRDRAGSISQSGRPVLKEQAQQLQDDKRGHDASAQQQWAQPLAPKTRELAELAKSDIPQRNPSFRERAAKNDFRVPQGEGSASPVDPLTHQYAAGSTLNRSVSNKLKKNPPGDPWYNQRLEAEGKSQPAVVQNRIRDEPPKPLPPQDSGISRSKSTNATLKKQPPAGYIASETHPTEQDSSAHEEYEGPRSRTRGLAAAIGLGRSASLFSSRQTPTAAADLPPGHAAGLGANKSVKFPEHTTGAMQNVTKDAEIQDPSQHHHHHHHLRDYLHRSHLQPGQHMYQTPKYLDEWKKASVGTLSGALLDITAEVPAPPDEDDDKDTAWWENSRKRRSSISSRPKKAEAFDGEYDETRTPSRFKPALFLKCGPLLRYSGIRYEKTPARNRSGTVPDREIWRGSVMIVTQDSESSYQIKPVLRLFVQPIDLLPPPPAELKGEQALQPEYVDPIAGLPKLGRRGETFYVRPVEHLEEAKDVSMLDIDEGLFEVTRSAPDFDKAPDPPGSFASRKNRIQVDGEKLGKYREVHGFRLHAERGFTFWRFNIEVELRDIQQRIAYRINRGPSIGFWVPARGQAMNVMFHSCNGFSLSVDSNNFSGPDPMWRDVLNTHQTQPFHVMLGGGDQIYNDAVMMKTQHFQDWLNIRNPLHKHNAPFTAEMQDELEEFYLDRYSMWFSQGLFGLANSQIPMVNMFDDHDIIDGYGSYPDHFMKTPVFSGLGAVAFKYYMLFQQQSVIDETEDSEPSWVLGCKPGPYIQELSRSLYMSLGSGLSLLAVDARTERTRDEVIHEDTWKKLIDRCYAEIIKGQTKHLLVLLGVPIAYPRLVWLENILTSRLMDPVKALGKAGLLGNFLNKFDGGVEVLDDLDDHWTAKNHKDERKFIIEDLQDLAADKSVRITILSGDVHLAAIGQFYSNPKLQIPKHKDFRYMPNVISSAIVNTPPPDLLADVLNKRNKVHHFDKETDENMIPIFTNGVDGKSRNNKHLLPHRNWCSIRPYSPGATPPPTPPPEDFEFTPEGTPPGSRGGLLRKFSLSKQRGPALRPDAPEEKDRSRPPVSGGLFRSFSRRASSSDPEKKSGSGGLFRSLSLGRKDSDTAKRGFFSRRPSLSHRPDDGGINGNWGAGSEEDDDFYDATPPSAQQQRRTAPSAARGVPAGNDKLARMGLRGGAGTARERAEYEAGDDSYFTARQPQRAFTQPTYHASAKGHDPASSSPGSPPPRPFHRTPTGLSAKLLRKGGARWEVDVEGALDVQLNVEVNPRDPAGITVPYRLLVPKLDYEYQGEDASSHVMLGAAGHGGGGGGAHRDYDDDYDDVRNDDDDDDDDAAFEHDSAGIEGPPVPAVGGLKRWFSGRGKKN
ncbi:hypothetical protein BX600DRAFT_376013 [Xylariales sp. PMI_506]|nr:hypothetical protein BX600DRAFT_376013 [Xylariales sp. PMI_506]